MILWRIYGEMILLEDIWRDDITEDIWRDDIMMRDDITGGYMER